MPRSLDLDDAIYDEEHDSAVPEQSQKDRGAVFCLVGAALLALGTVLPIASAGGQSVSLIGRGDGWLLFGLAILTAVLVFRARSWVLLSGLLAGVFVVYQLVTLAETLERTTSAQLAWGWPPMFIALGLIFWGYLSSPG